MRFFFTPNGNVKTGKIPVTMSSKSTCPRSCPHIDAGCYARFWPVGPKWATLDNEQSGIDFDTLIQKISELPEGQLWRHNQAGDLPGEKGKIDQKSMMRLIFANQGKRGFTYTHKPLNSLFSRAIIKSANEAGFTVNLSADSLNDADIKSDLGIGPVVVTLPANAKHPITTPDGRKVLICPAEIKDRVTCSNCGICYDSKRDFIVGFRAHGQGAKKIEKAIRKLSD